MCGLHFVATRLDDGDTFGAGCCRSFRCIVTKCLETAVSIKSVEDKLGGLAHPDSILNEFAK
jgi:hypothetical protein